LIFKTVASVFTPVRILTPHNFERTINETLRLSMELVHRQFTLRNEQSIIGFSLVLGICAPLFRVAQHNSEQPAPGAD